MCKKPREQSNSRSTRRAGRPRRGQEAVTPAVIEQIADLWLQGLSLTKIGNKLGIDRTTVKYHLDHTIQPQWHEDMRASRDVDLAKVALIEKTAWEQFHSSAPTETHKTIEKALCEGGSKPRIVKEVMKRVTKRGQIGWLQIIQWCIEFRAKVYGYFKQAPYHDNNGSQLRVAGKTPCQVDEEMVKLLFEKIQERRRQHGLEELDIGSYWN